MSKNKKSLLVLNKAQKAPQAEDHYEEVVFNIDPGVNVRHAQLEGRNYTVVPMVMITEGVHDGSNGPLYYPAEELSKTPAVWNHKPIVVYHPEMGHSACEHAILETSKVGIIMNTKYDPARGGNPGKLKAEAWLETDRLGEVDDRVADTIKNQAMMEVSTGLFMDFEETEGVWGKAKKSYETIARNYRPDHLAILPDQKGACAIADGAGLLRNSAEGYVDLQKALEAALSAEERDFDGVSGIFPNCCVYNNGGHLYKQDYRRSDSGKVSLKGNPHEVNLEFRPVSNTQGDRVMNKKQLVAALIANAALGFEDKDAKWLSGMSEAYLNKMLPKEEEVVDNSEEETTEEEAEETETTENAADPADAEETSEGDKEYGNKGSGKGGKGKKKPMAKNAAQAQHRQQDAEPKKLTLNDYLETMPPEVRAVVTNALATEAAEKKKLIATITVNKANVFKPEALAKKDLLELKAIARLAAPTVTKNQSSDYNFTGQGDVVDNSAVTEEEPLALPVWNYSKKPQEMAEALDSDVE